MAGQVAPRTTDPTVPGDATAPTERPTPGDVLVSGGGAPVTVFAPGLGASIAETRPFGSGVAGTRVFLTFHGRTYADLADELRRSADAAGARRAVGVSLGAGAIMRLIATAPDRFERLVLVLPASLDSPRPDVSRPPHRGRGRPDRLRERRRAGAGAARPAASVGDGTDPTRAPGLGAGPPNSRALRLGASCGRSRASRRCPTGVCWLPARRRCWCSGRRAMTCTRPRARVTSLQRCRGRSSRSSRPAASCGPTAGPSAPGSVASSRTDPAPRGLLAGRFRLDLSNFLHQREPSADLRAYWRYGSPITSRRTHAIDVSY